jgi:site-specific DNA-methyltransferase (adenine-specific)
MKRQEIRAPMNRTLVLSPEDNVRLRPRLLTVTGPVKLEQCLDKTICGDAFEVLSYLPRGIVDLAVVDPPYNLTKSFNGTAFIRKDLDEYVRWLRSWLSLVRPMLKETASIYICSEWRTSTAVHTVAEEFFNVQNRITWERDKGRGAQHNWKNCSEDIWFCTVSNKYQFNVEAVKLKRRVLAPYRSSQGEPKDWESTIEGDFRTTHPSNLWSDITVPFWSMPENTEHPTQKPEKLIAKLILASSRPGELVLDPFLGSGTTSVVAKKLNRHFVGIEAEEPYSLLAERRLEIAEKDKNIQGYSEGVFWERNSLTHQVKQSRTRLRSEANEMLLSIFGVQE